MPAGFRSTGELVKNWCSCLALVAMAAGCGGGDDTTATDDAATALSDAAIETAPEIDEDGAVASETLAVDTAEAFVATCNPYTQTGCDTGKICVFLDANTLSCLTKGTVPVGSPCGGTEQCESGGCLSLGPGGFRCYQFCKGLTWCPKGSNCIPVSGMEKVCSLPSSAYVDLKCDLLKQDCQQVGDACYQTDLADFPICQAAGTAGAREPCTSVNECAKGLTCNGNKCFQWCGTGAGSPQCPATTVCSANGMCVDQ